MFNVFPSFTPNKVATFDNRDPPLMAEIIKLKIQQRNNICKKHHRKNSESLDYEILQSEMGNVASTISERNSNYDNNLAQKLIDPPANSKTYWSILNTFFNGKRISSIPPLNVGNRLVSDFK